MKTIDFPYKPQARQKYFHFTTTSPKWWADEILYGGAAGGGKSAAIVGDAFKNACKYPNINILILRRTLNELEGSILLSQLNWYPREVCKYQDQKKVWKFFNGSRIWLGYCEAEKDVYRYQGKEFEIIYMDEATHFTKAQFKYLKSRNRTANQQALGLGLRPQMKLTTNPGGVGHAWVKERFIDIGPSENVHEVQEINDDGELVFVRGVPAMSKRVFIPAKLSDNNYIDDDYEAKLHTLDEKLRKQLLDGDWDTMEGQFFEGFNRSIHVIKPFAIPSHWRRFTMHDEGYNDPYVSLWGAVDEEGNLYIYRELVKSKLLSHEQVAETLRLNNNEDIEYHVGDTSFWNKSKTSGESPAEVFAKAGWPMIQATKERVNGWKRVRSWLDIYEETDHVTGELYQTSKLKIFENCKDLIKAIPLMIRSDKNPEDMEDHPLDHTLDALRYGVMSRPAPTKPIKKEPATTDERFHQHVNKIMKKKKKVKAI